MKSPNIYMTPICQVR